MVKDILIFSDGTGQIGGLRPDQRLSNVYKMYRAMRPGPDSPISPKEQVAFYDSGLGTTETGSFSIKRVKNSFAAAVGTGIDENVIDCYAAIIADYEIGDRVHLFGFSRGAYTVRVVANVLNLCGIPTQDSTGKPVPRYGPLLRKIASDGVRYVYNHGAGHARSKYEEQREVKAKRFRIKYGSDAPDTTGNVLGQGNVQPTFVGVFDTVAALGSKSALAVLMFVLILIASLGYWGYSSGLTWLVLICILPALLILWNLAASVHTQFKYFFEDPERKINLWNPLHWVAAYRHGHMAWWSDKNYDEFIDREVKFVRHALAVDEARANFPRVRWGAAQEFKFHSEQGNFGWMKQVWFAGNHSDIGGSYPESESRLSDISLGWMLDEVKKAVPSVKVRDELVVRSEEPNGLQHDEIQALLDRQPNWIRRLTKNKLTWSKVERKIDENAQLHPSILVRYRLEAVPQMGSIRSYRPNNLLGHKQILALESVMEKETIC
jgi:hypothetical protein